MAACHQLTSCYVAGFLAGHGLVLVQGLGTSSVVAIATYSKQRCVLAAVQATAHLLLEIELGCMCLRQDKPYIFINIRLLPIVRGENREFICPPFHLSQSEETLNSLLKIKGFS